MAFIGALVDVTDRAIEGELRYRSLVEQIQAITYVADWAPDAPLRFVSPQIEGLLGFPPEDWVSDRGLWAARLHPEDRERVLAGERRAHAEETDLDAEYRMIAADGSVVWFWERAAIVRDAAGRPAHTQGVMVDVTGRKLAEARLEEAEAELRRLAFHDPLTGLPNRSQLDVRLRAAVGRARRRDRAVALLFIDLDNFKLVNDSLGHSAGDRLLRRVATRLGGVEEPGGLLARHGGDEFLVLLDDLEPDAAEAAARAAADDIAVRLAKPFQIAGAEFHVEASVGISLFPGDADGAHALLQHADAAMYQSKGRGRAASTVYARKTHDPLERLSLSSRLRRAIAGDELELHYQPIVWTASGRLHSMEALLRWNDPERGLVHPDRFIPAAEEMSLLDPIGEWVVGAMARQLREWEEIGPAAADVVQRLPARAAPAGLRARADRAAARGGRRPDAADDGADRVGDAARARADRAAAARAPRRRACRSRSTTSARAGRRCRGCASCPCRRSRSTARSCARSPTTPSRARSCAR